MRALKRPRPPGAEVPLQLLPRAEVLLLQLMLQGKVAGRRAGPVRPREASEKGQKGISEATTDARRQ